MVFFLTEMHPESLWWHAWDIWSWFMLKKLDMQGILDFLVIGGFVISRLIFWKTKDNALGKSLALFSYGFGSAVVLPWMWFACLKHSAKTGGGTWFCNLRSARHSFAYRCNMFWTCLHQCITALGFMCECESALGVGQQLISSESNAFLVTYLGVLPVNLSRPIVFFQHSAGPSSMRHEWECKILHVSAFFWRVLKA